MTKRDLIEAVAQQYPRFSHREAEMMVNVVFDSMTEALGMCRK
jgi:nucleoid DNA-binding protein